MSDKRISRRETLKGAAAIGVASTVGASQSAAAESASVEVRDQQEWYERGLIDHIYNGKMLVNRERADAVMDKYGLDGLVAASPKNVYYLSSHRGPSQFMGRSFSTYALLPRNSSAPAALIVPGAMAYHLDFKPTWMPSVQVYSWPQVGGVPGPDAGDPSASPLVSPWALRYRPETLAPADRTLMALYGAYHGKTTANALVALKKALLEAGLSRGTIGFDDPRVLPWLRGQGLDELGGTDAENIFKEIRMVKTANEIELLREAAVRNEKALDYAIDRIEPGLPLIEIERAHNRKWGELHGQALWLVANVHGLNTGVIKSGDFMKLDSVGAYEGYLGDVGRTVSVGPPSDELARRVEANAKASQTVYDEIRPGMPFVRSWEIFSEVMRQEGFEHGPAAPHPVGLDHTDLPWPTGSETEPFNQMDFSFEDGMVFTLDMPYHEIGWGTTHVEDMMLVTESGAVPLSSGDLSLRVRPG